MNELGETCLIAAVVYHGGLGFADNSDSDVLGVDTVGPA